jgi:hypothetical protein
MLTDRYVGQFFIYQGLTGNLRLDTPLQMLMWTFYIEDIQRKKGDKVLLQI